MIDEFGECLKAWREEQNKPFVPKPYVPPIIPQVSLTDNQKRVIIKYKLGGVGKGLFEDRKDFWKRPDGSEMTQDEIEDAYSSYRTAADDFVEKLKQHLLDTI